MKSAPNRAYHEGKSETLLIFDVRIPGAAARLHTERATWPECSDIDALDQHRYILVVRPGGAYGK